MKIGERGQVTIPRKLRERFGLGPATEVEFEVESNMLVLKKVGKSIDIQKWVGKGNGGIKKMGYKNSDDFVRDIRGPMITALDTNVLFDVILPNVEFVEGSIQAIQAGAQAGSLIICDVVYAELCFEFSTKSECDRFLDANRINVAAMNKEACFLASRAWQKYRRQGGPRTRILPDFFIGAHAMTLSSQLISRDSKIHQKYFPQLKVVDPAST